MTTTDPYASAATAAEAHLENCWAFLNEDCEEPDTLAPYCGCVTCEVREVLAVAVPILRAAWEAER